MAYISNSHHSYPSLGYLDPHNLGFLNADLSSSSSCYHMEDNNNAASLMMLPTNSDHNYSNNLLSTGYLEDALIEFSVRFKRRRLMVSSNHFNEDYYYYDHCYNNNNDHNYDPFATHHFDDDLGVWSNLFANYGMQSQDHELNHANFLTHHHDMMHYSLGEIMEKPEKEVYKGLVNYEETKTLVVEEAITTTTTSSTTPKLMELSPSNSKQQQNCCNKLSTTRLVAYNSDSNSTDSSTMSVVTTDEKEKRKMKKVNTTPTKMVYPFGLVKPGGEEGDITLKDINKRILMPPTRPLKHPVGDFACRPAVSPHGPGLSGKAVVALTKIHTQGRGTITIIRTKG